MVMTKTIVIIAFNVPTAMWIEATNEQTKYTRSDTVNKAKYAMLVLVSNLGGFLMASRYPRIKPTAMAACPKASWKIPTTPSKS